MRKIAILGLGAMGSRMAAAALAAGYEVWVWNRSPGRARQLLEQGAHWAQDPADAARKAQVVMSMVRDDEASREVWRHPGHGALAQLAEGSIGIECSTISVGWAEQLSQDFENAQRTLIAAPVLGSRAQVEARQLIQLIATSASAAESEVLITPLRPLFECWAKQLLIVESPRQCFQLKLLVNALLAGQLNLLAELLSLAQSWGLADSQVQQVLPQTPVFSPALSNALPALLARQYAAQFPVDLVVKDLGYLLQTEAPTSHPLSLMRHSLQAYASLQKLGLGEANISAIREAYA